MGLGINKKHGGSGGSLVNGNNDVRHFFSLSLHSRA
jgi:hypothetical protein